MHLITGFSAMSIHDPMLTFYLPNLKCNPPLFVKADLFREC